MELAVRFHPVCAASGQPGTLNYVAPNRPEMLHILTVVGEAGRWFEADGRRPGGRLLGREGLKWVEPVGRAGQREAIAEE